MSGSGDSTVTLDTTLNDLSTGSVNLAAKKYVNVFSGIGYEAELTETDYVYTLVAKSYPGGIVIDSNIFKPDAYYVLSFKFKFTAGIAEINGEKEKVYIAGHSAGFICNKAILDGVEVEGEYSEGYEVINPELEHSLSVYFKRRSAAELETIGQPELYIQPERVPNPDTFGSDATIQLWDLQITEGTIASAWIVPAEDAQENRLTELSNLTSPDISYQYTITDTGVNSINEITTPGTNGTTVIWTDSFDANWNGVGNVWRRTVTAYADPVSKTIYSEPIRLTAAEAAKLAADANRQTLGEWCANKNITIIDGSNLMTGTIDANRIKVTNLSAGSVIVSGSGESATTLDNSLNSFVGVNLAASKYVLPFEGITMDVNDYVYTLKTEK